MRNNSTIMNYMKLSIHDEQSRFLRGTIILTIGLLVGWFISILLNNIGWCDWHWMINLFFYATGGAWIGQFLAKIIKLPTWVNRILCVFLFIGSVFAYYLMPAMGGLYDWRAEFHHLLLFIPLGYCAGYVEEKEDRMWEWIIGFCISIFLLAFLSYLSQYIGYTQNYLSFLDGTLDWDALELHKRTDVLLLPERLANRFIIVPLVPSAYFMCKLVMSNKIQGVIFKK